MKYLFLDIECSNGSDICSIGYVIADDKFNVIQQKDMLINPESKFVLSNRAGTQGIKLAYSEQEFYAAPAFPHRYEEIKSLLEDPLATIIGFAVSNDAGFIKRACERYALAPIQLKFFDVQRLDAKLHNDGKIRGLSKILDFYGIEQDDENILHKSDDDAFFTMEILQKMLDELNKSVDEVIAENPWCSGELKDGEITYDGQSIANPEKMRKKDVEVFRAYCADLEKKYSGVQGCMSGCKLSFERAFESKNYSKMLAFAQKIYSEGGIMTAPKECNMFVYTGKENSQTKKMRSRKVKLVTVEELTDLAGWDEDALDEAAASVPVAEFKKRAGAAFRRQKNNVNP